MVSTPELDFRSISEGERTIRFAELGQGTPVVLLHGFPDGPTSWIETATAIADKGHRAIVPYLRGYHPDTIVDGLAYDRNSYGGDVIALLDALDLETAIVVGHDWGSSSAWAAYSLAPDRFAGIVPIAVPHPATIKPSLSFAWQVRHFWYFKAPGSEWRTQRNELAYIRGLYERWAPRWQGVSRQETESAAVELLSDPNVLHHSLEWYRDLALGSDETSNFRVDCPGLVVVGGADFGGDISAYRRSVDRFDGPVELLVIEGAGHWPHREDSDTFIERLISFINKCA